MGFGEGERTVDNATVARMISPDIEPGFVGAVEFGKLDIAPVVSEVAIDQKGGRSFRLDFQQ